MDFFAGTYGTILSGIMVIGHYGVYNKLTVFP